MTFRNLGFVYFEQHGIEVRKCGREEWRGRRKGRHNIENVTEDFKNTF
jgi:hypothetical protein